MALGVCLERWRQASQPAGERGFQPQVGGRTGGRMPPSLATKMDAATFADRRWDFFVWFAYFEV
jgi:hypothetical protein